MAGPKAIEFGRALLKFLNIDPDKEAVSAVVVDVDFSECRAEIIITRLAENWVKEVGQEISKEYCYKEINE